MDAELQRAIDRFHAARQALADALGPGYHDYAMLGVPTQPLPGIFAPNQRAKAPVITAFLARAIASLRLQSASPISAVELFCADAYYAMLARALGAERVVGIDSDRDGYLAHADRLRSALRLTDVELRREPVEAIDDSERYSIVLNVGGLYHVADPERVLDRSYALASHFLIVQTVVSLATDDVDYFEAPAPGLPWGNRYSRAGFERTIERRGWRVVDRAFNELTGNERLADRGSLYYLISTASDERR
jgi:hypothetical protein